MVTMQEFSQDLTFCQEKTGLSLTSRMISAIKGLLDEKHGRVLFERQIA
jgi:hypothetical protein